MRFSAKVIDNLNDAARSWERDWDASIAQNFIAGGRPAWPKTRRGGSILQQTGRLRNAIGVKTRNDGNGKYTFIAKVQAIKYARLQQYGGVIRPVNGKALAIPLTPEAAKKKPRSWGKRLFFVPSKDGKAPTLCITAGGTSKKKGYKKGDAIPQYALLKSVRIPGRPYLVVQKEDAALLKSRARDAIKKGMKK